MNPTSRQNNGLWGSTVSPTTLRDLLRRGRGRVGCLLDGLDRHPALPATARPAPQPAALSRSSATTSRISPAWVGSSLVSYAVRTVAGPDGWDRCRAGTQPAPCWATTNTNAVHPVSRSPAWTSSPTASRKGGRSGIWCAVRARTRFTTRSCQLSRTTVQSWSRGYRSCPGTRPARDTRPLNHWCRFSPTGPHAVVGIISPEPRQTPLSSKPSMNQTWVCQLNGVTGVDGATSCRR
jgi:hypothetical protein